MEIYLSSISGICPDFFLMIEKNTGYSDFSNRKIIMVKDGPNVMGFNAIRKERFIRNQWLATSGHCDPKSFPEGGGDTDHTR